MRFLHGEQRRYPIEVENPATGTWAADLMLAVAGHKNVIAGLPL